MNKRIFFILCFSILQSNLAKSNSCEKFFSDKASCSALAEKKEFVFSDGTKLSNPLSKVSDNNLRSKEASKEISEEELLDAQVLFSQSLETVAKEKMSPRFKASLMAQSTNLIPDLFSNIDSDYEINIPWPPQEENAVKKSISIKQLKAYVRQNLPATASQDLFKIIGDKQTTSENSEILGTIDNQISEEKIKRSEKIFKQVKESFIKRMLKGRTPDKLSTAEKSIYEKLNSIRLLDQNSTEIPMSCSGSNPNAFYIGMVHAVGICGAFHDYPESALVTILTHEIAHSIDPCTSQFPLLQLESGELFQGGDETNENEVSSSEEDQELLFAKRTLQKAAGSGNYSVPDFAIRLANPEQVLAKSKSKYSVTEKASGIDHKNYPYLAVKSCFQSIGFRGASSGEVRAEVEQVFRHLPKDKKQAKIKEVTAKLQAYPECLQLTQPSELNETMSDYFASEAIAEYFERHPPKSENDKLAPFLFFAIDHCQQAMLETAGSEGRQGVFSEGSLIGDLDIIRGKIENQKFDEHAPSEHRMKKIFLSNPKVAKALSCEPGEGKACFDSKLIKSNQGAASKAQQGTK